MSMKTSGSCDGSRPSSWSLLSLLALARETALRLSPFDRAPLLRFPPDCCLRAAMPTQRSPSHPASLALRLKVEPLQRTEDVAGRCVHESLPTHRNRRRGRRRDGTPVSEPRRLIARLRSVSPSVAACRTAAAAARPAPAASGINQRAPLPPFFTPSPPLA